MSLNLEQQTISYQSKMVDGKTARENRICPLCNNGEIGDQFHYLFKCQYFGNQRKMYIKKNIRINPNIIKFKLLMTSTSKIELQKLCRFVRIINKGVSTPG